MSARRADVALRAAAGLTSAALAASMSGCLRDLEVGLSMAAPPEGPPVGTPHEDAGTRADAQASDADTSDPDSGDEAPDASADASAPFDAAARDAGHRDADARIPDARAPDAQAEDACTGSAATGCHAEDAGGPEPCLSFECVSVQFTPAAACEYGMRCERDDAGMCGWTCVPPFAVNMEGADAEVRRDDAGP